MINYIKIIKGHYLAAQEHIKTFSINHKVTYFQAAILTLKDIIRYKHIQIGDSYLVYQPIHINTLGVKVATVIRVYVPKELRGMGIAHNLRDKIPEKVVIEEITYADTTKYRTVGTTCVVRSHI